MKADRRAMWPNQVTAIAAAVCGGMLLAPTITSSLQTDRWALLVLALASIWLIVSKKADRQIGKPFALLIGLALVLSLIGTAFQLDKALLLAGVFLIAFTIFIWVRLRTLEVVAIGLCLLALVPVPAGLEASVGVWLAEKEAWLFVTIAQSLGLALHQFGSQIISGDVAVTVNASCSGTLMIWPALLGCLVVAVQQQGWGSFLWWTLSALLLSLAINLVRIFVLLVMHFNTPVEAAAAFHDLLGWSVMPLVWIAPMLLSGTLPDFRVPSRVKIERAGAACGSVTAGVLLVVGLLGSGQPDALSKVQPLPLYVNGWVGKEEGIATEEARILAADTAVRRSYTGPSGHREILVTSIYHRSAKKAGEHLSAKCFEALGWIVEPLQSLQVSDELSVRHLLVRSHDRVQAVVEAVVKSQGRPGGVLRLQLVEDPTIPVTVRHRTLLEFLKATSAIEDVSI